MADLEVVKNTLSKELVNIAHRIDELKTSDPFSDPDHTIDNAAVDTDVREQEAHLRIQAEIDTLKERQINIQDAIARIEKGRYGYCKRCNTAIPEKRLELIPESKYCVQCEGELKQ